MIIRSGNGRLRIGLTPRGVEPRSRILGETELFFPEKYPLPFTTDRTYALLFIIAQIQEGLCPHERVPSRNTPGISPRSSRFARAGQTAQAGGSNGSGNGRLTVEGTTAFATQRTFILLALR